METHLTRLRDTLQAMERLHQKSYRQYVKIGELGGERLGEKLYEKILP